MHRHCVAVLIFALARSSAAEPAAPPALASFIGASVAGQYALACRTTAHSLQINADGSAELDGNPLLDHEHHGVLSLSNGGPLVLQMKRIELQSGKDADQQRAGFSMWLTFDSGAASGRATINQGDGRDDCIFAAGKRMPPVFKPSQWLGQLAQGRQMACRQSAMIGTYPGGSARLLVGKEGAVDWQRQWGEAEHYGAAQVNGLQDRSSFQAEANTFGYVVDLATPKGQMNRLYFNAQGELKTAVSYMGFALHGSTLSCTDVQGH